MSDNVKITVAKGDGIGPEIMDATLKILNAADCDLEYDEIKIGEDVYKSGNTTGIDEKAWDSLNETKVFLKAPITTPQGGGYKSLNVTTRKTLSLFANVRPCVSYNPFVKTNHPDMDTVIIRENEEDLYAAIEHRQTREVYQCLKLITRPGCEKIIRYAFEYAVQNNRKKVTAISKDNIMKLTDGLFHKVFNEIKEEYPDIESDHMIVDIGTAKLANDPSNFDVIVTLNLYGDIISDVAAEITGSVGLAGSANIGENYAMFEAIHGSAPDIAGQGIANPSGLLLGAVMMLNHLNMPDKATLIHNAWLKTIEDGTHTGDIYRDDLSKRKVNTKEFADAVIENMGKKPETLPAVSYKPKDNSDIEYFTRKHDEKKELVGVDVFIDWWDGGPDDIGKKLENANTDKLKLVMITNRGVKVYPKGHSETFCTDHWRCRFQTEDGSNVSHKDIIELLSSIDNEGFDFIKMEHLCKFDGKRGYSLGQGQ